MFYLPKHDRYAVRRMVDRPTHNIVTGKTII